jgi:hypothetical protein
MGFAWLTEGAKKSTGQSSGGASISARSALLRSSSCSRRRSGLAGSSWDESLYSAVPAVTAMSSSETSLGHTSPTRQRVPMWSVHMASGSSTRHRRVLNTNRPSLTAASLSSSVRCTRRGWPLQRIGQTWRQQAFMRIVVLHVEACDSQEKATPPLRHTEIMLCVRDRSLARRCRQPRRSRGAY